MICRIRRYMTIFRIFLNGNGFKPSWATLAGHRMASVDRKHGDHIDERETCLDCGKQMIIHNLDRKEKK